MTLVYVLTGAALLLLVVLVVVVLRRARRFSRAVTAMRTGIDGSALVSARRIRAQVNQERQGDEDPTTSPGTVGATPPPGSPGA